MTALPSDRAGGLRPEPAAQSQPSALIPSAGDWVVFRNDRYDPVAVQMKQAAKVTPSMVKFVGAYHPRQCHVISVVAAFTDEADAAKARDAINGIAGEFYRRRRAAEDEKSRRIIAAIAAANQQIDQYLAQAMSAGTAKTEGLGGDSPASAVRQDAPETQPGDPS